MKKLKSLLALGILALTVGTMSSCGESTTSSLEPSEEPTSSETEKPSKDPIVNDSGLPKDIVPLGEPGVQIHYQRYEGSYKDWSLWLWAEAKDGKQYKFDYQDDFGVLVYVPLSELGNPKSIGFIVRGIDDWTKDYGQDRFLDIDFLEADENDVYHVYIRSGKSKIFTDAAGTMEMNAVSLCEFANSSKIVVNTNNPTKAPDLYKNGELFEDYTLGGTETERQLILKEEASPTDSYSMHLEFLDGKTCDKNVSIRKLYTMQFDTKYAFDGQLGAIYYKEQTIFRVWSPISTEIKLRIYNNGTPKSIDAKLGDDTYNEFHMHRDVEKGTFEAIIKGDLEGKYYTYFVINGYNPEGKEICDPYARSAGVNGIRGMVVDFEKTNPEGWNNVKYSTIDRKHLTVYETTVPDLTSSETWTGTKENAKKFKGVYEKGTTYTKDGVTVKTGFDHIKELGVNAIQFVPIFDQANDELNMKFNWGYNPLNYNVVEGGYSSNPHDGYARIRELKEMIKAFKDEGLAFIMDVVYNHVSGLTGSNFDTLMPYYYFRYTKDGGPSSGSGCGNDTASERKMFRKFMIDSTEFWTKEYKMDGFRFDLMGLHDLETMNKLVANVKKVNPNATIYGEPWTLGTHMVYPYTLADQPHAKDYVGFGQFNDKGRDVLLKGGLSPVSNRGWMCNQKNPVATDELLYMLRGSTKGCTDDPDKTVTYATCHDNYTLNDRCIKAGVYEEERNKGSNMIANSLVMLSQGTSFMLSGEEMLRTKVVYDEDGNPKIDKEVTEEGIYEVSGNSYDSCYKTNEIDYSLKVKHLDLFHNYQKIIGLKQTSKDLGLNYEQVQTALKAQENGEKTTWKVESLRHGCIVKITFDGADGAYEAYISCAALYNFEKDGTDPFEIDCTGKEVYLSNKHAGATNNKITMEAYEVVILKGNK